MRSFFVRFACVFAVFFSGSITAPFAQGQSAALSGPPVSSRPDSSAKANAAPASKAAPPILKALPGAYPAGRARSAVTFAKTPMQFEPNVGQSKTGAKYLAHGAGYLLRLEPSRAVLDFSEANQGADTSKVKAPSRNQTVSLSFEGARKNAAIEGEQKLPGTENYLPTGDPKSWLTHIPTYERVVYREAYPGVDLSFYGSAASGSAGAGQNSRLEYDVTVAPGSDASAVRLALAGADSTQLDKDGNLLLTVGGRAVRLLKPLAYQIGADGKQQPVDVAYALDKSRAEFKVGSYDRTRALVIDPVVDYSFYVANAAASGELQISASATDANGNTYIAGNLENYANIFIAKFNSAGQQVFNTVLGTNVYYYSYPLALAFDAAGDVYITGYTYVSGSSYGFPTTSNAYQQTAPSSNSDYNPYLAVLKYDGSALTYSTYLNGPNQSSFGEGVAVDSSGNAYVGVQVGGTGFPTTSGAFQTTFPSGGNYTAAIAKINPAASGAASLVYSTLLGSGYETYPENIAVDSAGDLYVTGAANGSGFPTTPGAYQYSGGYPASSYTNAFVSKLNPSGSALVYSSLLGPGAGNGLAIDGRGDVYVTGSVSGDDFPTTSGAYQTSYPGGFVTELNSQGSALVYSTFLGGASSGVSEGNVTPVDLTLVPGCASSCNAYVSGYTTATDFPLVNPIQSYVPGSGGNSAFVAELNGSGTQALLSSYFATGPAASLAIPTYAYGPQIGVDSAGNMYVTGDVNGSGLTVTQPTSGTTGEGFLAKIAPAAGANLVPVPLTVAFNGQTVGVGTVQSGNTQPTVLLENLGSAAATIASITFSPSGEFTETDNCNGTVAGGGYCTLTLNFLPNQDGPQSSTMTIASNGGSPSVSLSGTGNDGAFLVATPGSLSFANTAIGSKSAAQTVTIQNIGNQPVSSFSLSGFNQGVFPTNTNCPQTINPGQSCQISVTFAPIATGDQAEQIYAGGYGGNQYIYLSGTGINTGTSGAGSLALSDSSVNFGTLLDGTSSTLNLVLQNVYIYNTGSVPVTLTAASTTLSGTVGGANDFSLYGNNLYGCGYFPVQLNPASSCYFYPEFTPSASGTETATLSIANSTGTPLTMSLTGIGLASSQVLEFEPGNQVFPAQPLGVQSANQVFYVYNTGTAPVVVDRAEITGDFQITYTTCPGDSLAPESEPGFPGSPCSVYVAFTPTALGARTGTLTLVDAATGSPQVLSLMGTGIAATESLTVDQGSLQFDPQIVGTTSPLQFIELSNPGSAAVTLNSLTATGDYAVNGYSCGTPPVALAADSSCQIYVSFTPTSTANPRTGTLTIGSSAGNQTVSLTGTGEAASQAIAFTPAASPGLNFGNLPSGTASYAAQVFVRNTGTDPVTFTVAASITANFQIVNDYCTYKSKNQVLAAQSSCEIDVSFKPTAVQAYTGTLTLVASGPLGTQTLALNGAGIANTTAAIVNAEPLQFTQQGPYTTSSPATFNLYNYGKTATVTIQSWSITAGGATFIVPPGYDSCTGAALGPKTGSCSVGIEFAPQAGGYSTGTVTFIDTNNNTYTGTLAGYAPAVVDAATLTPSALTYPNQIVGTTQSSSNVGNVLYFTNTGTTNLTVGTLSGTNYGTRGEFFADPNNVGDQCSGQPLAPGSACNVGVAFKPSSAGAQSGSVNFPVTYGDATTATFTANLSGTGVTAQNAAVVSPSSVTYTDQVVGTTSGSQLIRLFNTGSLALTVGNLSYNPSSQFITDTNSYGDQCSNQPVPAGSNCYVGVDFNPTSAGAQSGTLTFPVTYSSGKTANLTATLAGNGIAVQNDIFLNPVAVNFGQESIGSTAGYQAIGLNNQGNSPVTIGTVTGTNYGATSIFSVYEGGYDGCSGQTIQPNQGCVVYVQYTPKAAGAQTGTLSFPFTYTGGTKTTLVANLSGTGLATSTGVTFSQTTVTFPSQQVGVGSQAVYVQISNPTATGASFSPTVGGADPGDFSLSGCSGIGPQSSCNFYIYFTPQATGARTATVTLAGYSGPGTAPTLTLKGTGTAAAAALTLYPSTLAFSTTQPVGVGTPGQIVTVTNNGSVAASAITGVTTTDTAEFPVVSNNCIGAALQPNQSCSLTVVFSPTSTGAKTASIGITPAQGATAVAANGTGTADMASTVTLASSASSAPVGTLISLTATVSASGSPVTNGTVTFYAGAKVLGTAQVVTNTSAGGTIGKATLFTDSLPLGANSITATYAGADSPGTATAITVTITGQYASANVLSSTGLQGSYTLLSTVSGLGPVNPTGSVKFTDLQTNTLLGTATVSAASALQSFNTAGTPALQPYPTVTALVDVNHDGKPDLITGYAQGNPTTLTVSLGNGDGTFQAPVSVDSVNYNIYQLAFGDFNGDGNIDIAASTNNNEFIVFLGKGNGTFGDEVGYGNGSFYEIAVGDFNGDGKLDIVASDPYNQSVDMFLGNGDGTFQDAAIFPSLSSGSGQYLVVGDFNGDGKLDVAAGPAANSTNGFLYVSVLLGNGNGTLQAPLTSATTGYYPQYLAAGDVNGDGKLDLITEDNGEQIGVLLGKGNGTFQAEQVVLSGSFYSAALADVNGDGKLDLVVTNTSGANVIDVAYGTGTGAFGTPVAYPTGNYPENAAIADINGDGKLDVVAPNYQDGTVTVLLNQVTETATLTGVTLPGVSSDNVSATYSGDTNFLGATSNILNLPSNAGTGSTTLTVTPSSGPLGTDFTLVASASNAANAPVTGGTITFYDGSTVLGTVEIVGSGPNAGTATYETHSLPIGSNNLSARFNGTDANQASVSNHVTVTVTGAYATATTLAASGDQGNYILTASLEAFGPLSPTGSLVFTDTSTSTTLGTIALTSSAQTQNFVPPTGGGIYSVGGSLSSMSQGDLNADGYPDLVVVDSNGGASVTVLLGSGNGQFVQSTILPGVMAITSALADVNGDGKLDLILGTGSALSVYLGNGDGTFQTTAKFTTAINGSSGNTLGLDTGDLNGDGKIDVVVSDNNSNQVYVLLGNGDGTFGTPAPFNTGGGGPRQLVVRDFNGDGKPDVAVNNYSSNTVGVLFGNGDGTLQTAIEIGGFPVYNQLASADLNGDGKPDLVSSANGSAQVILNQGGGNFATPVGYSTPGGINYLTIADVTGDGNPDIVVAESNGAIEVLPGTGAGTFGTPAFYATGANEQNEVLVGDFNADGRPDFASMNNNNTVTILLNAVTEGATLTGITLPGTGTDNVVASYSGDSNFSASTSAPVALYSNAGGTTTTLAVSPGTTEPLGTAITFTATVTDTHGAVTHGVVSFYNGTKLLGTAQLIGATDAIGTAGTAVFTTKDLPTGTASIKAKFASTNTDTASASAAQSVKIIAVAVATTTNLTSTGNVGSYTLTATVDGYSPSLPTGTVTFTDTTASPNYVLGTATMSGTGSYNLVTAAGTNATGSSPDQVFVADMNHDGNSDLVIGNYDGTMVSILLGNGDGTFQTQNEYGTNYDGVYGLTVGDLNGDGIPDVITGNGASLGVFLGTSTGALGAETDYSGGGGAYYFIAVGDFNRDGNLDVVAENGSGTLNVYLGNGDGTLQSPKSVTAGSGLQQVAVADLNGDGIPDLAVANGGSVGILLGNGDGTFQAEVEYPAGSSNPRSVAVADLNGDGKLDVVAADYGAGVVSVLLGNGDGTLQTASTSTVGNNPAWLQIGDINADGSPDIVVGNYGSGTIGVLLGTGTGTFQAQTTIAATSPYSIALGDFNNDGRLDIASVDYNQGNAAQAFLNQQVESATLTPVSVPGTGTHNVVATYNGDTNFSASTSSAIELGASSATSSIALAPTPSSATITYGSALSVLVTVSGPQGVNTPTGSITYSVAGGGTQTAALSSGTATLNLTGLQAGSASLVVNYAGDSLHAAAPQQTLAITVNKAPLSVVANGVSRTYGAANPGFTGTVTGLQYSDTVSATYATAATATSGVGTYAIVPTVTISDPANYSLTVTNGVLTVTQAPLLVTVANATKVYGAANPTFTDTLTGVQNGDAITVTLATTATTSSSAGTYPITATLNATAAVLANYTPTINNGTLTITLQPLTVTANNASRLYGAGNPTFTGTVVGLQGSDTVTVTYASSATKTSAVGSYSIVPTVTGAALSNYSLTKVNGVLSVTPAPLTIVVNNASRNYGAANPTFTGTVTGLLNSDTVTTTYSTTATVTSAVGTYPITAAISGTKAGNYTATVTNGTLTVGAAPLTVTVNSISKVYGSTNPTFTGTVTGLENGDGITTTYSTTATQYSSVGTYPITATVSGAAASNYAVTVVPATLTITQAILQIAPNNATRVYGSANPAFTGTVTGILNNDNVITSYSTTATVTSYVGTYPIAATISGTAAGNYNPQVTPGSLTITPAPLAVAVNAATKVYGAALPNFTTTFTTLLNGDVLTPTYATTATASSAVGSYSVTETLAGAALVNYTPTYTAGTLTVTAAPLSLTVANASRTYGAANPTFTGTLSGVVNGDTITPTYATAATVTSAVGTYSITATLAGANLSNYTQTITPGTLTVTPAPLTVTVANASRTYGAANPAFTGTVTGLLNGDTVTPAYSSAATVTSPVGTYAITATVTGATNYATTVVPGTLTVSPATLSIVVNNATRVYDSPNPTFTGTVSGLLNGDSVTTTYSTTATTASSVGTYPIAATISGTAAANYTPAVTAGTLTITALQAATPTISPAGGTYNATQKVTLADTTPGVTIYYTTNGSTPTTSSSVYSSPISVTSSETIETFASGPGGNYIASPVVTAAYTITIPQVATPVFTPPAGTYNSAQSVTIADATAGATIYYTTNGSTPTTSSTVYSAPIAVSTTAITIKAIAIATGYTNSAVASGAYTLQAPAPTYSPTAGTYVGPQSVTIADALAGSTIYYTTNGTTPTTSSTVYSAPIPLNGTKTIEAIATATGFTNSKTATAAFTLDTNAPVFSLAAGTYYGAQSVTITDATANATIYYTTNGSTPTTSSAVYSGAIAVSTSQTLKAIALASGYANSAVSSVALTISTVTATPVFSPVAGSYVGAQTVTITDLSPGSSIYYTTNGTTPTASSTPYSGPITVAVSETLKALATAPSLTNSAVASAAYKIQVPTPAFSLAAGTYTGAQTMTITDALANATIYYTTNGTTPTTASAVYSGPLNISASETVEALAVATGDTSSTVASAAYIIQTPTPTFTPAPGIYTSTQTVSIADAQANASIYYTTNGTTPTTSSAVYAGPITVAATQTIEALAVATGQSDSAIGTALYTINPPAALPSISPAGGSYTSIQTVTITDASSETTIYYTTNGMTPTASSAVYTGPITVASSETIEAIASGNGFSASPVASASFSLSLTAGTPVFTPATGTYNSVQSVVISDTTPTAIYYTTNGTTPTAASTLYTGPITVSTTGTTLKAISIQTGYASSGVASATYTLQAPTPVITPASGTYQGAQTATIGDALGGATIYYTTNGATPTTSSTVYSGPIAVNATQTIKAIAVETGFANSALASATLTLQANAPVLSLASGTYYGPQTVTISDALAGATIYYTTNGTKPSTSSAVYSGAITVSATETVEAIAVATGYSNSAVTSAGYVISGTTATPVFSPASGTYSSAQSVTITDATPNATIYYTTNGTTPTTASSPYSGPITVSTSTVIKAIAVEGTLANSAVATAAYTIH